MARKKKSLSTQKHQKEACEDDTSDEELKSYQSEKTCSHVSKAINLTRLKKSLKGVGDVERCKDCKETESLVSESNIEKEVDDELQINDIWLCLQCGYRGCGRNSSQKHAVQHFKTPHSDCHSIVLGLSSSSVWCYSCDSAVHIDASRSLKDSFEFISKLKEKKTTNIIMNGDKKSTLRHTSPNRIVNSEKPEKTSLLKSKETKKSAGTSSKSSTICISKTVKGLRNLGNTCFFNAVLQNLSQTPWLLSELEQRIDKGYEWVLPYPVDDKLQNPNGPIKFILPECYSLTQAFVTFLKQMNKTSNQSPKTEVLNPTTLFDQICKKSPQFSGFHQQDSHELLRQLLDGIRNEEIKRQKKAILKALNIDKIEEVDEITKQLIKGYGSFALHTVVERIFGGQLLSTVVCEECKGSSQVFEPFMDLSLPLIEEKPLRFGKLLKHEDDEDNGLHCLQKKKNLSNSGHSKHQEKKLRQQARKATKKQAKLARSNSSLQVSSTKDETEENESLSSGKITEKDEKIESNEELSDADIEDNEDTESIPKSKDSVPTRSEVEHNVLKEEMKELWSQITELRIRRDSDKQEDLLESMEDSKQRKSIHSLDLKNTVEEDESEIDWSHSRSEVQTKEWMMRSLTTLKPRYQPTSKECSLNSCLNQFTASELLTGSNKFRCENCTKLVREKTGKKTEVVYSNASKQLLIFSPPAILTLHLKRFQQTGMSLRKLNSFVEFPEILDLAPYCSSVCLRLPHMSEVEDEVLYSLYGIVQHSGRLTSGHYTAYVKLQEHQANPSFLNSWPMGQSSLEQLLDKISKVKLPNELPFKASDNTWYKWYYVSDSMFKEVSLSEVLKCQAYILFYQRIK